MNLKLLSLCILVLQNSSLVLLIKYSKQTSSSIVLHAEIVKLLVSCILISKNPLQILKDLRINAISMSLPAVLYLIQNNLQFLAVGLLEPGTFQVLNQLKILSTAVFSVVLLDKRITKRQWVSLLILMIGIGIVQISNLKSKGDNQILGFYYIIVICVLSGISGVW